MNRIMERVDKALMGATLWIFERYMNRRLTSVGIVRDAEFVEREDPFLGDIAEQMMAFSREQVPDEPASWPLAPGRSAQHTGAAHPRSVPRPEVCWRP